jgi:hypothetical protein
MLPPEEPPPDVPPPEEPPPEEPPPEVPPPEEPFAETTVMVPHVCVEVVASTPKGVLRGVLARLCR